MRTVHRPLSQLRACSEVLAVTSGLSQQLRGQLVLGSEDKGTSAEKKEHGPR